MDYGALLNQLADELGFGKLDEARQIRVVDGFANSIKRPLEDLP